MKSYCITIDHLVRNKFMIECNSKTLEKIKKRLLKDENVVGLIILEGGLK